MYAVIETGGKQYKVSEGDVVRVEKLKAAVGASLEIPVVRLFVKDDTLVTDAEELENVKVLGTVTAHKRGKKLRIFKMKRRKGYRRKKGHRQALTEILITRIETQQPDEPPASAIASHNVERMARGGGIDNGTQESCKQFS